MVNDEKKKEKIKPLTEPWDTFDILSAVGAVVAVAVSVYFFGNGGNQDAVSRMSLSPILEMVEGLGNFSIALGEVIWVTLTGDPVAGAGWTQAGIWACLGGIVIFGFIYMGNVADAAHQKRVMEVATLLVTKQRQVDKDIHNLPTPEELSGAVTLVDHAERAANVKHWELALSCYKNAIRLDAYNFTITARMMEMMLKLKRIKDCVALGNETRKLAFTVLEAYLDDWKVVDEEEQPNVVAGALKVRRGLCEIYMVSAVASNMQGDYVMEAGNYLLAADLAEENGDTAKQKECQDKAEEAKRLNDELNKIFADEKDGNDDGDGDGKVEAAD